MQLSFMVHPASWAMRNDLIQGYEWSTCVALDTLRCDGTRDHLRGESPMVTECS